jgi:NAD dependent epimerase/dehydratase family enzyme
MDLALKQQYPVPTAGLRVAVTGSSGMIGAALVAMLSTQGITVQRITRKQANGAHSRPDECSLGSSVEWDMANPASLSALSGCDAVIHLGGEPVASFPFRWTAAKKARILRSREENTAALCDALAMLEQPPSTFVCASAIGIYGRQSGSVETPVTEEHGPTCNTTPAGESAEPTDFLQQVCRHCSHPSKEVTPPPLVPIHPNEELSCNDELTVVFSLCRYARRGNTQRWRARPSLGSADASGCALD